MWQGSKMLKSSYRTNKKNRKPNIEMTKYRKICWNGINKISKSISWNTIGYKYEHPTGRVSEMQHWSWKCHKKICTLNLAAPEATKTLPYVPCLIIIPYLMFRLEGEFRWLYLLKILHYWLLTKVRKSHDDKFSNKYFIQRRYFSGLDVLRKCKYVIGFI